MSTSATSIVAEPTPTISSRSVGSIAPPSSAVPPAPTAPPVANEDPWPWPRDFVPPTRWQTKTVTVDGVKEQWSLDWESAPHFNGCAPASQGCFCEGIEWGLTGKLELVRERDGELPERLDLNAATANLPPIPYAENMVGQPEIPGFQPPRGANIDMDHTTMEAAMHTMVTWPHADAMRFSDYDHDGRATELVVKIGYVACGQDPSVVVGISKDNPRLHVFGPVEYQGLPLVMTYLGAWDDLARAQGPIDIALHHCGDHGGSGIFIKLSFDAHGLHAADSDMDCDWSASPPREVHRPHAR